MPGRRCKKPLMPAAKRAEAGFTFRPGSTRRDSFICARECGCTVEAGATIYATLDSSQYDDARKAALIYGEDLHDIALEGAGTLDGQATYEWHLNTITDAYILGNQRQMEATGKPLMRSFPTGFGKETVYPRMVLLLRCVDVRIAGLKFLRSRSWTINPYACKRLVIDGVYIYSSQKEGVWADGIDPDGCQDVHISNSTIETGDDAIVFYSTSAWGPVLPTENVTVTNSRLSSSSSAIKFCDGNSNAVRHVTISNVVITNSNRGLAFMVFDGGIVEDVVIDNVTIDTRRFDWFWWGDGDPIHFNIKRRSEVDGVKHDNEPAGRHHPQRDHQQCDRPRPGDIHDAGSPGQLAPGNSAQPCAAVCVSRNERTL